MNKLRKIVRLRRHYGWRKLKKVENNWTRFKKKKNQLLLKLIEVKENIYRFLNLEPILSVLSIFKVWQIICICMQWNGVEANKDERFHAGQYLYQLKVIK